MGTLCSGTYSPIKEQKMKENYQKPRQFELQSQKSWQLKMQYWQWTAETTNGAQRHRLYVTSDIAIKPPHARPTHTARTQA